jgi:hypothetical protein
MSVSVLQRARDNVQLVGVFVEHLPSDFRNITRWPISIAQADRRSFRVFCRNRNAGSMDDVRMVDPSARRIDA